jgi:hypothetical protein
VVTRVSTGYHWTNLSRYSRERKPVDQAAALKAQRRDLMAVWRREAVRWASEFSLRPPVLLRRWASSAKGDVLVVTKIDRLARSIVNLCEIIARIERRKASLRVLAMNLDTGTPTGKLILNVVGSIAEVERDDDTGAPA